MGGVCHILQLLLPPMMSFVKLIPRFCIVQIFTEAVEEVISQLNLPLFELMPEAIRLRMRYCKVDPSIWDVTLCLIVDNGLEGRNNLG